VKLLSGTPHAIGQCPDIGEDSVDEAGFGVALGVEVEGETLDEGRADDGGVGGTRHSGGLARGADAEPYGNRVKRRSRATAAATLAESAERVPVMPAIAT
jgi:hypothetical protein